MPRVHFVALGCPKNRVDSEQMAALTRDRGLQPVAEPEDADAIVVHTCGFIAEAKEESVETILEMAQHKRGRCRALVVTGCLVQRHADELAAALPEVDALLGTTVYGRVAEVIEEILARRPDPRAARTPTVAAPAPTPRDPADLVGAGRELGDHGGQAYLKIAEGCDRSCAFCVIPALRGPQRSRPLAELVEEARGLADAGVRELNLIAQELTGYGRDLEPRSSLVELLQALDEIEGLRWIRCLYAYPQGVTRPLRRALARSRKVLPYLDVPIQHASDGVLRRMRRGKGGEVLGQRLARLWAEVPGLVLRTTLLVGFPGESEADFAALERFVEETSFDRLGVFPYSDEAGTAAARMRNKVPRKLAQKRERALMRRQARISRRRLKQMVGTVHEAIVEGLHPESELLVVGRLWTQAPEIDGITYLSSEQPLSRGQVVKARVVESHDHDLVAEVLEPDDPTPAAPFATRGR